VLCGALYLAWSVWHAADYAWDGTGCPHAVRCATVHHIRQSVVRCTGVGIALQPDLHRWKQARRALQTAVTSKKAGEARPAATIRLLLLLFFDRCPSTVSASALAFPFFNVNRVCFWSDGGGVAGEGAADHL
jgi:hypothetical protein